jgi:GTP:adenosylcobinamide-phosphate guanylyltransferase
MDEKISLKIKLIERKRKLVDGDTLVSPSDLIYLQKIIVESLRDICYDSMFQIVQISVMRVSGQHKALEIEVSEV